MQKTKSLGTAVLIAVIVVGASPGPGQVVAEAKTAKQVTAAGSASQKAARKSGEQVFTDNCSRCHKPPMSISPRVTGTVIMHMRVRAKLSRQDEQALLHYLAP